MSADVQRMLCKQRAGFHTIGGTSGPWLSHEKLPSKSSPSSAAAATCCS